MRWLVLTILVIGCSDEPRKIPVHKPDSRDVWIQQRENQRELEHVTRDLKKVQEELNRAEKLADNPKR